MYATNADTVFVPDAFPSIEENTVMVVLNAANALLASFVKKIFDIGMRLAISVPNGPVADITPTNTWR